MTTRGLLLGLACTTLVSTGCGDGGGIAFFGRVYDGVTGARISHYNIRAQFGGSEINGGAQEDGRFTVGPVPFYHDYTIIITADGYRRFLSHNSMPINGVNDQTSFDAPYHARAYYYDAVLFPENATAPAATLDVTYAQLEEPASGTARLWPTHSPTGGASSLLNDYLTAVTDGHLNDQRWDNDEDLQQATVQKAFSGGVVDFAPGELTFGVTYNVHIFNLNRHQPIEGTFTAGYQSNASFVAEPLYDTPLEAVYVNASEGTVIPDGHLVIVFNQPIEFDKRTDYSDFAEIIDNGISVAPATGNILKTDAAPGNSPDVRENHTSMQIVDGMRLAFTWDRVNGMESEDAGNPIQFLTWGDLDQVLIRPVGGNASTATDVASLVENLDPSLLVGGLGGNSIEIQLRIHDEREP